MPVKKSKVKTNKSTQKTQNTQRIRKSDVSDTQKIRYAGISEFSESSGRRLRGSLTIDMYDVKGKVSGKVSLPKELFGAKVNPVLMAQAVRVYLANHRKGTASTKTRGEVNATTAKVWRQKGTGRARHGAKSAPIWVGGGVVFGPKPRDFSLKLPKHMRRNSLASALTSKMKAQEVKVVEGLEKLVPKTKSMYETLSALTKNQEPKNKDKKMKVLLVIPGKVESVQRAARNIDGVTIRPANLLTTYEVLDSKVLLFMKDSLKKLEETWIKETS